MASVSVRLVAYFVELPCLVIRKLKRATTLEFSAISAIIFYTLLCFRD